MKKTCMVDKFYPGTSYSAGGYKFNINESRVYILKDIFKKEHTENKLCTDQLTKMLSGFYSWISPRSNDLVFTNSMFAVTL